MAARPINKNLMHICPWRLTHLNNQIIFIKIIWKSGFYLFISMAFCMEPLKCYTLPTKYVYMEDCIHNIIVIQNHFVYNTHLVRMRRVCILLCLFLYIRAGTGHFVDRGNIRLGYKTWFVNVWNDLNWHIFYTCR